MLEIDLVQLVVELGARIFEHYAYIHFIEYGFLYDAQKFNFLVFLETEQNMRL